MHTSHYRCNYRGIPAVPLGYHSLTSTAPFSLSAMITGIHATGLKLSTSALSLSFVRSSGSSTSNIFFIKKTVKYYYCNMKSLISALYVGGRARADGVTSQVREDVS